MPRMQKQIFKETFSRITLQVVKMTWWILFVIYGIILPLNLTFIFARGSFVVVFVVWICVYYNNYSLVLLIVFL